MFPKSNSDGKAKSGHRHLLFSFVAIQATGSEFPANRNTPCKDYNFANFTTDSTVGSVTSSKESITPPRGDAK